MQEGSAVAESRGSGPKPPTAEIDEIEYQRRLAEMYTSAVPEGDVDSYLLGVAVQRMAATMRLHMDTLVYQPAGVSIANIRILIALATVGPTTPGELARLTQVSPSSISSVLRTLRRNGHVTVEGLDDSADGRVKVVRLLPEGEEVMRALMGRMSEIESSWAAALPESERRDLIDALRRMAQGIDAKAPLPNQ
jgi:DNA-binding MarR family transcriptional regulator